MTHTILQMQARNRRNELMELKNQIKLVGATIWQEFHTHKTEHYALHTILPLHHLRMLDTHTEYFKQLPAGFRNAFKKELTQPKLKRRNAKIDAYAVVSIHIAHYLIIVYHSDA